MGKLSKKEQQKQSTQGATQYAMATAEKLRRYNTLGQSDEQVRQSFQGAPLTEKDDFINGLFAERGWQDPLAQDLDRGTTTGLMGTRGMQVGRLTEFSPVEFRRTGGKPGFKLRGVTDYGAIEKAFAACYNMSEETREQIAAKLAAYEALQQMCSNWKDKHNLEQGGSGGADEANKAAAVMQLYTHIEAKRRQLNHASRNAPSDADRASAQFFSENNIEKSHKSALDSLSAGSKQKYNSGNNTHEQNMALLTETMKNELNPLTTTAEDGSKNTRIDPVTGKPVVSTNQTRAGMDTYRLMQVIAGKEASQYVFGSCYSIAKRHMMQWVTLQNNPQNLYTEGASATESVSSLKAQFIIPLMQDCINALFANVPEKVLDSVVAIIRGMLPYSLINAAGEGMDLKMFAADTLMLRLFNPALQGVMHSVINGSNLGSVSDTGNVIVRSSGIATQCIQRLANKQTGGNAITTEVLAGCESAFTAASGGFSQLVAQRLGLR